jgi:hypothetical protein
MAKSSPLSGRIGTRFGGRGARKRTRIFAGFITLIAVTYFGSTFAASISLGSTSPIEFGQGSRAAVACDSDEITTAIEETWDNDNLFFIVNQIILSDVNNSATDENTGIGCQGKKLIVRLINDVDGPLLIGSGSNALISFVLGSENVSSVVGATDDDISVSGSGANEIVTITLPVILDASTVTRVALETE